jgi:alpha-D-xyloside xylohydrolase
MWHFKDEFYEALRKANRLRYQLMPYIYSEAGKVWQNDQSLIRWLAFDFTEDKNTWELTDQFMFGDSLMVCPVTGPMYYEPDGTPRNDTDASRMVYFPAGCDWYDFYTGEKYAGGSTHKIAAPLDTIPVFAREGSVIPLADAARSTEEQGNAYTVKQFPGKARPYAFYRDAGDGYGYERGEYEITTIS